MEKTKIVVDKEFTLAEIDKRLYGSFIEHLGRAVYEGIYQPGHASADEDGFRKDTLELVKELNVPVVRYPGGNYVSNFYWEDSVGPVRKPRLDLAWRTLEPNDFGLGEFAKWAKKADTEIMMALNLGTRGVTDALNLLEYCNLDADSYYADMRRSHGRKEPYDIKLWCLGNEMDGPWQVGHKTAEEYGRLAAETAKAMKFMDPSIELISCGSSTGTMDTFPMWEETTLTEDYDYVDYISLHSYYGNSANDTEDFFASADDMDSFINTVTCACDFVKAKKRSKKTMKLSFDEWNVWFHQIASDEDDMAKKPWRKAPHLLEDHYDYEDAIMDGLLLITLINHSDRVRMACLAQLVNVIAPIMTETDGKAWGQTIFYPFMQASCYGRGTALHVVSHGGTHSTSKHENVTDIKSAAVWNKEKDEVTIFAVNRHIKEAVPFEADMRSFEGYRVIEYTAIEGNDMLAVNDADNERVKPSEKTDWKMDGGIFSTVMKPASWNVIRFGK